MSQNFQKLIQELCQKLSLNEPEEISEIVSLQVGEQAIHITEFPENSLLMFSYIDFAKIEATPALLQRNIFGEEPLKPILGQDKDSQDWILWSRQPFNEDDGEKAYHQLEILSDANDKLLSGDHSSAVEETADPLSSSGIRV
ncbi:CesT family type III secretion system chaperone [Algicola sagamiensis]|uniref:CesT family type III secretion system chaperone n=1 Tax=Algicola sagamiensis TaxID=163869 RepID=UPI0003A1DB1C|nr:CesT family type III secretion system chaperone [Algicola sagamiensis]